MKFDQILKTTTYVVENSKYVKINYDELNEFVKEIVDIKNEHYMINIPYDIYNMSTKDIVNFLLIYDAIDFSFWGSPKWTIKTSKKDLDGGIALLHCIYNLFKNRDSIDVYNELEYMTLDEFSKLLEGNVNIPLLEERYKIVTDIAKTVNNKMNGDFYSHIISMKTDIELFNFIIENFPNFEDTRTYNGEIIYFYKLAQLLISDIFHVIEHKEKTKLDYSNLIGCADYKIPQVMQSLGILEYSNELVQILEEKVEIPVDSKYEVEIRASMLVAINYIYEILNKSITRIEINDYIWSKGQDKTKIYKPYHLTRTTSY